MKPLFVFVLRYTLYPTTETPGPAFAVCQVRVTLWGAFLADANPTASTSKPTSALLRRALMLLVYAYFSPAASSSKYS
ncbi:MAG: hypothetical protein ABSD75_17155 [Terriglobales bacterium]